jgi:hypothetical protein
LEFIQAPFAVMTSQRLEQAQQQARNRNDCTLWSYKQVPHIRR